MLDLKAKLLAAGLVTAAQVKKVEDEEATKKARVQQRRPEGTELAGRRHGSEFPGRRHGEECPPAQGGRQPGRVDSRPDLRTEAQHAAHAGRVPRKEDDPDEKRARREHEWNEAQRWRKRLEQLQLAGKSEQYEAVRGWVMKDRLDNKQITEAASRFHFVKHDGAVSHLTVEPDVQQRLTEGTAAVVAFMGYNGIEHAVVPKDIAKDVQVVRAEWVRHLVGVTDLDAPAASPPNAEPTLAAEATVETPSA